MKIYAIENVILSVSYPYSRNKSKFLCEIFYEIDSIIEPKSRDQQCVTERRAYEIAMKNIYSSAAYNKLHHQMFLIITRLESDRGFIIMHHIVRADVKTFFRPSTPHNGSIFIPLPQKPPSCFKNPHINKNAYFSSGCFAPLSSYLRSTPTTAKSNVSKKFYKKLKQHTTDQTKPYNESKSMRALKK